MVVASFILPLPVLLADKYWQDRDQVSRNMSAFKEIKSIAVTSLANGNMLVEVEWKKPEMAGVCSRMALASAIFNLLQDKIKGEK